MISGKIKIKTDDGVKLVGHINKILKNHSNSLHIEHSEDIHLFHLEKGYIRLRSNLMVSIMLSKHKDSSYQQLIITSGGGNGSQAISTYWAYETGILEFIQELEQEIDAEGWEVVHEDVPKTMKADMKEKLMFWK